MVSSNSDQYHTQFDHLIGKENAGIINGRVYNVYHTGLVHHPFLDDAESRLATVQFKGQSYSEVLIRYDIYLDRLVLETLTPQRQSALVELARFNVSSFSFDERQFLRLEVKDSVALGVRSGYFELLTKSAEHNLLVKRRKTRKTVDQALVYTNDPRYFVATAGTLAPAQSLKHFYALFPDRKQEIKQFVKKNDLKINRRNEQSLIQLSEFCQGLSGS